MLQEGVNFPGDVRGATARLQIRKAQQTVGKRLVGYWQSWKQRHPSLSRVRLRRTRNFVFTYGFVGFAVRLRNYRNFRTSA